MTSPTPSLLRADALFHRGAPPEELRGVSLAIEPARFTLLSGSPGSGAGLLLRVLGLLERPDAGEVWFDSQAAGRLDDAARLDLRNHAFGFIFAEPFLLDSFTVAENVAMPLFKISGLDIQQARCRTSQVLEFTGLAAAADLCVADLSPLDHHKVALARALAIGPRVLVAEDAGLQLPPGDFRDFAALLRAAPGASGVSVIATTSPAGADILSPDREVRIEHGAIAADSQSIEEAPAHD
jgi:ABC-type lipoprotein export system ATPase subunit